MYVSPRVNESQFSPTILESQNCPQVLTLLTLSEARGGGVSVRSLIISTSETYCKFMSKMSAWLGFPLEEGHSGEKIKLRKIGANRALTHPKRGMENTFTQGWCNRCATSKRGEPHKNHSSPQEISAYHLPPAQNPRTKRSQAFQSQIPSKIGSLRKGFCHLSTGCMEA